MFLYTLASVIAATIQIGTIYFLKGNFFRNFLYAIPLILAFQFLFLWSYTHAPRFIIIWFVTAALTNGLALLVSYFVFKESLSIWNLIGIGAILIGLVLLQFK